MDSKESNASLKDIVLYPFRKLSEVVQDQLNHPGYIIEPRIPRTETDTFLGRDDDDDTNRPLPRDKILQKIREKKEVMGKLRCQPWNMRRKRRTLKLAQKYLEKHESRVSKTHLLKEELNRKWKKFTRWMSNMSIYLIPWENKIKTIESHFGSVVSSYFTFLRWIFWVNFMITCLMTIFIVIPECLGGGTSEQQLINNTRKYLAEREYETADHLQTLWDFKGYLAVTPLFYGFYSNNQYVSDVFKYQLPLAYFLVNLIVLGYSFFAVLRKMAANARMSKLASGKTEQYVFCWKLFTGWDYTIGNSETASNTVMATVNKLRESIAEYRVKLRTKFICLRFMLRIMANIFILGLQAMSAWVIFTVVERSKNLHKMKDVGTFRHNEVPIVVSFITLVFPNIFELFGFMERYHPRTALRLQLGRVLILYVLNYYTLIFALFTKLADQQRVLDLIRLNMSKPDIPEMSQDNYQSQSLVQSILTPPDLEYFLNTTETKKTRRKRDSLLLKQLLLYFQRRSLGNDSINPGGGLLLKLTNNRGSTLMPLRNSAMSSRNPRRPGDGDMFHYSTRSPNSGEPQKRQLTGLPPLMQLTTTPTVIDLTSPAALKTINDTVGLVLLNSSDPLGPRFTKQSVLSSTSPTIASTILSSTVEAFIRENISQAEFDSLAAGEIFPRSPANKPGVQYIQQKAGDPFKSAAYHPKGSKHKGGPRFDMLMENLSRDGTTLCWENMIGQEIAKIITTDLVMNIGAIVVVDFLRGLWVRYCSIWWCWNLETTFPEYGEFKVAENVLHIINNQGMIWLGMFFAPLLPAMNNIKLIVLMYIRAWAVMTCNVPAQQIFRASRSSNFYLMLLLLMLFLCTLPVGYVIASRTPSSGCGPFSGKKRFYHILTDRLGENLSPTTMAKLDYIASPGVVIPVLVLLILVIYFLVSLVRGLREANEDLRAQLLHERTDEKRKIYQLAGGGKDSVTQQTDHTMPNTTHVDLSFMPAREQSRREPWRKRDPLIREELEPLTHEEGDSDDEHSHDDMHDTDAISPHSTVSDYSLSKPGSSIRALMENTGIGLLAPLVVTSRSRSPMTQSRGHPPHPLSLRTLQEESAQESGGASDLEEVSIKSRSEGNLDPNLSLQLSGSGYEQTQSSPGIAKNGDYSKLMDSTTDQTEESELPATTDDEIHPCPAAPDSARSWLTPRTPDGIREYLLEDPELRAPTPQFPSTLVTPRQEEPLPKPTGRTASDSTYYDNLSETTSPRSATLCSPEPFQVTPFDLQRMISPTEFTSSFLSSAGNALKKPFEAVRDWSRDTGSRDVPRQPLDHTTGTDETEMTALDTDGGDIANKEPPSASVAMATKRNWPDKEVESVDRSPEVDESELSSDNKSEGCDSGAEASTEEVKGVPNFERIRMPNKQILSTTFAPWPAPKELKKVGTNGSTSNKTPPVLEASQTEKSSSIAPPASPKPSKLSDTFRIGDKPPKKPVPGKGKASEERESRSAVKSPIRSVTVSVSPSPNRLSTRTPSPQRRFKFVPKDDDDDVTSQSSISMTSSKQETDV